MSSYRACSVSEVSRWAPGVTQARVEFPDGSYGAALVFEELVGEVRSGDRVIVNTTAVELGLGSGGFHFVLWSLSRDSLKIENEGHIMKLRYTPIQFNVTAVEERISPSHGEFLDVENALEGIPVVCGSLHSQLLPAAVAYRNVRPGGRLVYIMTDGGSLPIRFSRTVRFLRDRGYLDATITCGHAFGGDYEAVNLYGALVAARRVCNADAVVALMGPGIVGTGTAVGFSGMEQAVVINAVASLGGAAIAIPRITFGDERERHRGLSHHTVSALTCGACVRAVVAMPRMDADKTDIVLSQLRDSGIDSEHEVRLTDATSVIERIEDSGFEPTVMGRSVAEEPEFFMAAGAAGLIAAEMNGG